LNEIQMSRAHLQWPRGLLHSEYLSICPKKWLLESLTLLMTNSQGALVRSYHPFGGGCYFYIISTAMTPSGRAAADSVDWHLSRWPECLWL